MYELMQVSDNCYYIQSPAKIGLVKLNDKEVCLIDSGNDKDAGKMGMFLGMETEMGERSKNEDGSYVKDADGNYVLNENGDKIPVIQMTYMNPDGTVTEVYSMTQEQADRLVNLIATTTKRADYNTEISDIVTEQAAAYFEGQKSAEEVARLIQSKANIFVNEQR